MIKRRDLGRLVASVGASLGAVAAAPLTVRAATPAAPASTVPERRVIVEAVQMPAWISRDGQSLPLAPGDAIEGGQEVITGPNAGILLRLPEGSMVRMGEKTRLGINRLLVIDDEGRTAMHADLKLFDGFFRFNTSAVAKAVGTRDVNLALRTATVGIRGTDFWTMTDPVHDAVCLFEGKVDVGTSDQGSLPLDRPNAFWARFFEKPAQPVGLATPADLAKFISTSDMKPGQGIAFPEGRWRIVALATSNSREGVQLVGRLRAAGFPANLRSVRTARGGYSVTLDHFASKDDASAVLRKIGAIEGVSGQIEMQA